MSKDTVANFKIPEGDAAHEIMMAAFEHFLKHREVILKKLEYAREATKESLDNLKKLQNKHKQDNGELKKIERYDEMWQEVLNIFKSAGLSEDNLEQIDGILDNIPTAIEKYYKILLEQDKALKELIEELKDERYQKAYDVVNKVQNRPDPLSGLEPEEFQYSNQVAFIIDAFPRSNSTNDN